MTPNHWKTTWNNISALGLACLLTAGCGVGQSPQVIVAHKIADALPQALGLAAHYDVTVSGSTFGLARGQAREVVIQGQDVQIDSSVTLDRLTLDAHDIEFDAKSRQVKHIGSAEFVANLGQAHLNQYLARARSGLTVTLGEHDMQVALPVSAGPLHTTVRLRGELVPTAAGADTLNFVADQGQIGMLPVPAFAVNTALEAVNPVLSLAYTKVPIEVQSADVEAGMLTLRGTAQLGALSHTR